MTVDDELGKPAGHENLPCPFTTLCSGQANIRLLERVFDVYPGIIYRVTCTGARVKQLFLAQCRRTDRARCRFQGGREDPAVRSARRPTRHAVSREIAG